MIGPIICGAPSSQHVIPGVHDDLDAVLLLLVEDLVGLWRLAQRHLMRDHLQPHNLEQSG